MIAIAVLPFLVVAIREVLLSSLRKGIADIGVVGTTGIVKVACIGDYITQRGYPRFLGELLGPRYNVTNYGAEGQTLSRSGKCYRKKALGSCSYWNTDQFTDAQASHPDIVIILLGTNDAKAFNWQLFNQTFVEDYLDMIRIFAELPSEPLIFLGIPPPVVAPPNSNPGTPIRYQVIEKVINSDLRTIIPNVVATQASKQFGGTATIGGVVDTWSALGGTQGYPNLTNDGIHPTEAGLTIVARAFAKAIAKSDRKHRATSAPAPPMFTVATKGGASNHGIRHGQR